jgi:hypothetical protein
MLGYATHHHEANVFSISFSAQTLSTGGQWDLFGVYASTGPITRVELVSLDIGFSSSAISTNPQALGISLLRGSTASSTSTASALNLKGWANSPTAASSATGPSSTPVSTASASLIWSGVAYTSMGYSLPPLQAADFTRPVIASGQRLHVRLAQPQVALTASGTLVFKELGAGLAS